MFSCANPSDVPGKSVEGQVEHIQQVDEGAGTKDRLLIVVKSKQKISSNNNATDTYACKLPQSYAPTVQHFDGSQARLILFLKLFDLSIYPLVKPAHFELCDSPKECFQYFESTCSTVDVQEFEFVDAVSYFDGRGHHDGSYGDPEEEREGEFVEEVEKYDSNVEALKDQVEIALVVVVEIH